MSLANDVVAPASAAQGTLEDPIIVQAPSAEDEVLLGKVDPPECPTGEEDEEPEEQNDPPATVLVEKGEKVAEAQKQSVIVLTEEAVVVPSIHEHLEEEKKEDDPATFETSATTASPNSAITNLFKEHAPGVVADEELGLVAMFQEIHHNMPEAPGKELARAAVAHIFTAWADLQKKTIEAATTSAVSPRSSTAAPTDEEDISMTAMFKEVGDAMPGVQRGAAESMDAILAQMLLAVSHVPELVSPTVTEKTTAASKEEDLSLAGMFKEIASLIPGGNVSEKQVETHMVGRVEQIMTTH